MIGRALACSALVLAIGCVTRAAIPPPRAPLAATPATALAPPPDEHSAAAESLDLGVESHRLGNGMRVLVSARDQGEGLASVVFVTRGGAFYDARTSPAATHALSRLLLRATHVGDEVVEDYVEAQGFRPTVTASEDGMIVQAIVDAAELPRYLEALGLALTRPAFRAQDLERAKDDDGELLDGRMATPYGVLDDRLAQMLYADGDPRAYSLGRWRDELSALSIDTVEARHAQILDPTECTLVITGDVSAIDVTAVAERAFGGLRPVSAAPAVPAPRYREGSPRGLGIVRALMRSYVRLVDSAPGLSHPDHAAFLVLEQILGGMFTARLNLAVRERSGASYGLHARYTASATAGQLAIETAIEPAHARSVVQAIVAELGRVRGAHGGLEERELSIAKTRARELLLAELDTTFGLAGVLAQRALAGQEPSVLTDALAAIDRLDVDAVEEAAQRWLRPDRAPIAVVGARDLLYGPILSAGVGAWEIVDAPERSRR